MSVSGTRKEPRRGEEHAQPPPRAAYLGAGIVLAGLLTALLAYVATNYDARIWVRVVWGGGILGGIAAIGLLLWSYANYRAAIASLKSQALDLLSILDVLATATVRGPESKGGPTVT